ncbi:bacteriocin [Aureibaculum algae]|uniref:Bacteriocin n=2 Tax=Aureibaculum algae TaxID=2584122 RepID=A0A5B7TMY0_9FLAO|nr:bacteriocin [Aureibaculum algae]
MKNIDKYGVKIMSTQELKNINGGYWWRIITMAIAIANDAVNNPDDVVDGYNATRYDNADAYM